jgi:uncharacterized protein with HEPN domain
MKKDNTVYLKDMLQATDQILDYCKDCDYAKFVNAKMIQDAVIRNLEILGEAATNISDEFVNTHPDLPIKQSRGMRNLLIHHYDFVDVDEIWAVIENDLLPLKKELQKILEELS